MASPGKRPKVGDIVCVEWTDANSDTSEVTAEEASDLVACETWGVVLAVTDKFIRVGSERLTQTSGAVSYRAVTTVPHPWVVKVSTST